MPTLEELREDVAAGTVDTVIACFTDMQGRLMGKRLDAEFFLSESEAGHPSEGCNYLLALEMEMDPVPGYAIASWERGYGDFGLRPDLSTLRRIPWHEATVMVQCDVEWHDGTPVAPSPRQVLRAQIEKAHALGFTPKFGSELEFFLFRETYLEAHAKHFHDLTPSVPYILDYHVLAARFDEPFLRTVRTSMKAAGMTVESSKGEAWAGQHEINFRFTDVANYDFVDAVMNKALSLCHDGLAFDFLSDKVDRRHAEAFYSSCGFVILGTRAMRFGIGLLMSRPLRVDNGAD